MGHGAERDDGVNLIDAPAEDVTLGFGADGAPPPPPPADDTLHDYLQFADTTGHLDAGLAAQTNTLSPLDDYLHAAGISPDAVTFNNVDLPPTEVLIDLAHPVDHAAPADHATIDDAALAALPPEAVGQPPEDTQHHGV